MASVKKLLVVGADDAYFRFTRLCLTSFRHHHPEGWDFVVMDVGLTSDQRTSLGRLATVIQCDREDFKGPGLYVPSAAARLRMLSDFAKPDTVALYSDSDIIYLGSYERTVERFLMSQTTVAMLPEDVPAVQGFFDGASAVFPKIKDWGIRPQLNTGIMIFGGSTAVKAAELGQQCESVWPTARPLCRYSEQSVINGVMYENEMSYTPLTSAEHCLIWHYNLRSDLTFRFGPKDRVTLGTGEPVLARHFYGGYKRYLYQHLDRLESEYGIHD